MTSTTTEPALTACPTWCRYPSNFPHGWDSQNPTTGELERDHVIEHESVKAGEADHGEPYADAFVTVSQIETVTATGATKSGAPMVSLTTQGYPRFSAAQARRVAATLLKAADELDEINGVELDWTEADFLGALSDLSAEVARSFALLRDYEFVNAALAGHKGDTRRAAANRAQGYAEVRSRLAALRQRVLGVR